MSKKAVYAIFSGIFKHDGSNKQTAYFGSEAVAVFKLLAEPFFQGRTVLYENSDGFKDNWSELCRCIERGLVDAEKSGESAEQIRKNIASIGEYVGKISLFDTYTSWVKSNVFQHAYPLLSKYSQPEGRPTGWM